MEQFYSRRVSTPTSGETDMKRWILFAALGAGLVVAGCEVPGARDAESAPPVMDDEMAAAAADQAAPAAATGAPADALPADASPLPPEQRSSEETVQPESETLFY